MQHDDTPDTPDTPAPGTRVRFAYEDPEKLARTAQVFKEARRRRAAREAAEQSGETVPSAE